MNYRITYAVWGETGWQPHDIGDDYADTLDEARNLALDTIVQGAQLGNVTATIIDNATGKCVEELD